MSIDRSLTVRIVKWKNMFKPKHACLVCMACIALLAVVNSNMLILYGGTQVVNGTVITICRLDGTELTSWIVTWNKVSGSILSSFVFDDQ